MQNRLADQQQQYSLKIHEVLSDLDRARKEMVSPAFVRRWGAGVLLTSQKRGVDSAHPSAAVLPSRIPNPLLTRLAPPAETPAWLCVTPRPCDDSDLQMLALPLLPVLPLLAAACSSERGGVGEREKMKPGLKWRFCGPMFPDPGSPDH